MSAGRLNCPFPDEAVARVNPVAWLATVIDAPTTRAPDLSVTVPEMVAVPSCAIAGATHRRFKPNRKLRIFPLFKIQTELSYIRLRIDGIYFFLRRTRRTSLNAGWPERLAHGLASQLLISFGQNTHAARL